MDAKFMHTTIFSDDKQNYHSLLNNKDDNIHK